MTNQPRRLSELRILWSVAALIVAAIGSTATATLWEKGKLATWFKLPPVGPQAPLLPPPPDVLDFGPWVMPGDVDADDWTARELGSFEVRFPGEPVDVDLKWGFGGRGPAIGVRTATPFEGYAAQDVSWFDSGPAAVSGAVSRFATFNRLPVAKSEAESVTKGVRIVERVYPMPYGELTVRAARRGGAVCLLVAVGPRTRPFLDSLRDTRPPPPTPARPESIHGLVARWPLDGVRGAALSESISDSTAIVPPGYAAEAVPGERPGVAFRLTDGTKWANRVEFDLADAVRGKDFTVCYWYCRTPATVLSPLSLRQLGHEATRIRGDPSQFAAASREWVFVAVRATSQGYSVSVDGGEPSQQGTRDNAPLVGLDLGVGRGEKLEVGDLCVYERVLTDAEVKKLAGLE